MKNKLLHKIYSLAIVAILLFAIGCKRTEIPVTPDPTPTNPTNGPVNDAA